MFDINFLLLTLFVQTNDNDELNESVRTNPLKLRTDHMKFNIAKIKTLLFPFLYPHSL